MQHNYASVLWIKIISGSIPPIEIGKYIAYIQELVCHYMGGFVCI
jgi:hypothetical protein